MPSRNHIVDALIKEVLGPRHGPTELLPLNQDPRDEYITGVLAPADADASPEIDAEVEDVLEEVTSEEDEEDTGSIVAPSGVSPALDPKALPRSIGLSFILQTDNASPEIELCATWARYFLEQQGWQRIPAYKLTGRFSADQDQAWNDSDNVSIQVRCQSLSNRRWRVSIFLINRTDVTGKPRPDTSDYLFQPQIRVRCSPGTELAPVLEDDLQQEDAEPGSVYSEDASLSLLYRSRTAMARGHLCGVTWREIDPERTFVGSSESDLAPFTWADKMTIPEMERSLFTAPDVRTELMPCYPSEAPNMQWDSRYGAGPELSPERLSETWNVEAVEAALRPLMDGYQRWIADEERKALSLTSSQRSIVQRHIEECYRTRERIERGIEAITSDEDVRLAFCFANKAIHVQSEWAGKTISWRPFQLAFILLNIGALADPIGNDRRICDLLWFPTGGGKTEAYLGLTAFTLALRRLRARGSQPGDYSGAGVGVLSRYTLRLLTIQQFRRAVGVISACELLRVFNLGSPGTLTGWRPSRCARAENFLWGGIRFSVGLWVGGKVTSNNVLGIGPVPSPDGFVYFPGAVDVLQGGDNKNYNGPNNVLATKIRQARKVLSGGEPAQILSCPCCKAILAVPDAASDTVQFQGLEQGKHTLHFICEGQSLVAPAISTLQPTSTALTIDAVNLTPLPTAGFFVLTIDFSVPPSNRLTAVQIDSWWYQTIVGALSGQATLMAARPSRPGYFILTYSNTINNSHQCDFEIYCPNPTCLLNQQAWAEQIPISRTSTGVGPGQVSAGVGATPTTAALPAMPGMQWQEVPQWCQTSRSVIANRIPIPAVTVDDQVFHRCPSLVIATVDKFARLAFEPKASALFGNISHYHSRWGYYREGAPPSSGALPTTFRSHPPGYAINRPLHVAVRPFLPPSLILQDELHLIEGPLGSMVGLYETAIDALCTYQLRGRPVGPKYIASTATVRQAQAQIRSLFDRELAQFPPWATESDERFFARDREAHPFQSDNPGRLALAICAPGKGAQTPIIRIWSALLQAAHEQWVLTPNDESDSFYTLVGYFNAIRELAGAVSLFRQDIPERLAFRNVGSARSLDSWLELSSRRNSMELPGLLERLSNRAPEAEDAVFATSMFGTGVDITRLGLMIIHGQPKTTASYIQATGRVGRLRGGLVITFLRASRPRDLDHYEFFTGYQRAIYRHVESITVSPFSPRARERALGPLAVALLRQAGDLRGRLVAPGWRIQQRLVGGYYCEANRMVLHRHDSEVGILPDLFEARGQSQGDGRRPPVGVTAQEMDAELDLWKSVGAVNPSTSDFVYSETSLIRPPSRNVVLGDHHHRQQNLLEAFENAPQSLRDIEETTAFKV